MNGPVAQLVEQLTFNQWVAGSNPAGLTTNLFTFFFNTVLLLLSKFTRKEIYTL